MIKWCVVFQPFDDDFILSDYVDSSDLAQEIIDEWEKHGYLAEKNPCDGW